MTERPLEQSYKIIHPGQITDETRNSYSEFYDFIEIARKKIFSYFINIFIFINITAGDREPVLFVFLISINLTFNLSAFGSSITSTNATHRCARTIRWVLFLHFCRENPAVWAVPRQISFDHQFGLTRKSRKVSCFVKNVNFEIENKCKEMEMRGESTNSFT